MRAECFAAPQGQSDQPIQKDPVHEFNEAETNSALKGRITALLATSRTCESISVVMKMMRTNRSLPTISDADDGSGQARVFVHTEIRLTCRRSLFMFDVEGVFRRASLWLVHLPAFKMFIFFLILASSVLLATYDYRDPSSVFNRISEVSDPIFTALFTFECVAKIIAWGFVLDDNSYLRNAWNWLDAVVVVTGWASILPLGNTSNWRFLLVFKVLRPLRAITVNSEMKVLVDAVLISLRRLSQFCFMLCFTFCVFGIIGLNFWAGVMFRQCRSQPKPTWDELYQCWEWPVAAGTEGRLCGGYFMCEAGQTCGTLFSDDISRLVPDFGNNTWVPGRTPSSGGAPWCSSTLNTWEVADFNFHYTHFDNFPFALLVVFQCMTMEGWTDIMYMLQDADSYPIAILYFPILVTVAAFFLVNVALAVVTETFEDLNKSNQKKIEGEQ